MKVINIQETTKLAEDLERVIKTLKGRREAQSNDMVKAASACPNLQQRINKEHWGTIAPGPRFRACVCTEKKKRSL